MFESIPAGVVARIVAGGVGAERRAVDVRLVGVYGRRRARRLEAELAGRDVPNAVRLPPRPPAVENDLAALLVVSGATSDTGQGQSDAAFVNAGAFALALLRHAVATGGGCTPELNLAFLRAAASDIVDPRGVENGYTRAAAACPSDPTPLWALGEYQSESLRVTFGPGPYDEPAGSALPPFVTFRRLQVRFPGVASAWSGAGDAALRIGYQLQNREPFTARRWFAWAAAEDTRAVRLQPDSDSRAGLARAEAALGDVNTAVETQRRALAGSPSSADIQARLLDYLQRAHRFAAAAGVGARLATDHQFPAGAELYAEGAGPKFGVVAAEDAFGPLSTGVGSAQPASILLTLEGAGLGGLEGGGSTVGNLPFLPVSTKMDGIGGLARWCPDWSRRVDLLLSGHPSAVLAGFSAATLDDLRSQAGDCSKVLHNGPGDLAGVAELELGHVQAALRVARPTSLANLEDLRQNLWRYAGNFGHAAAAAQQWASLQPYTVTPIDREGEIAFLRHRYEEAATDFAITTFLARLGHPVPSSTEALALLDQGTALAYAGRRAEALTTLAAAAEVAARAGTAPLSALAMEEAGDVELNSGQVRPAVADYAVSAEAERVGGAGVITGAVPLHPEALENNEAIADVATGAADAAVAPVEAAVRADPDNPIFWWTEAAAEQALGRTAAAIADYRRALTFDPTLYPVANNLGVLLLRRGENSAAAGVLRRAVGANHGYAKGWFNLGVALEREGPLHVVASQGCLARARTLDGSLSSRGPVPLLDNTTYQSHLDLSKPLPAHWTFVSSQNRTSVTAAGLSAVLVLALGLARSLGGRVGAPGGAQKWFDLMGALQRRAPTVYTLHPPAIGILATLAFLLWPLHSGPTDGWAATLVFALGILVLIAVVLRVRLLAATRGHVKLREQTWPPALAFGLVLTLVGAGWSPLPVARTPKAAPPVHWAGPTAVAALAIVLLVLATWLQVPLSRSLGAAGLVMAASLLTPVPPLDGATVSSSAIGALPTFAVLGAAVLMLVGLL